MVARSLGSVSRLLVVEGKLIRVCLLLNEGLLLMTCERTVRPGGQRENFSCGVAAVELFEELNSEGVVIELGVCAGVGKSEDNWASR